MLLRLRRHRRRHLAWHRRSPLGRDCRYRIPGYRIDEHYKGLERDATAAGAVGGILLGTGGLLWGEIATTKGSSVTICIGSSC